VDSGCLELLAVVQLEGEFFVLIEPIARNVMNTKLTDFDRAWTASELRRLPAAERDDILAQAAVLAEGEYRSQPQLTDFEAFGEDDLHGDSTATAAG
jgi:hypothetical protein